ncbi:20742_t:CDS:2 [Gigaspora margarita]|uniref:20742_t:CDS:1 n=1 Tax=Gigaspora margarita TaxID=4874 RepID=A0ABN7WA06_GIGMA|nr:20742_t:CDS:2 [Gigaspora margarita]
MGTYDLEKEIHRILQDSSKIRDYNTKLRNEYMKINDEARRLKWWRKNNEPESSSASSEQIIPATICKEKILLVIVKKLRNLESIMPKEKVGYPGHKKYINKEEVPDRLGIAPKYINREEVPDRPGITPKYLPYKY